MNNNNSSTNISYYQNQPVSLQTNQMQQSSPSNYTMANNQQQQYYQQQPNNTFIQQQSVMPHMNVQQQTVTLLNGQMVANNYNQQIITDNTNSYQTSNQMQSVPWGQQNNQYQNGSINSNQQYIQSQQQQQQLPQNIPSQQVNNLQQQPKQIIKMNQYILAKPSTTPPPVLPQSNIASQVNQGQLNQSPQMINPQINPYSQPQVNYTQNINYVNNGQNTQTPKQLNTIPSSLQSTQQQKYIQQQTQLLNGVKPITNGQQIPLQNSNQQNNGTNQSAQFYTHLQQQPGVVYAQIQQQQPQQVYSTFINQSNVVQTNGIYSSPLQSNRIVYINNNTNTSNSTVQQVIPINAFQTNGNNVCIVQKPVNQMSNQQIVYAQAPIQQTINNQTPNKLQPIQLNQCNNAVNQPIIISNQNQTIPIVQVTLASAPQKQQTVMLQQSNLVTLNQTESVAKQPTIETKEEKSAKISASVHANIESTIDDMMKQYKMESKFSQDTDTNDKSFNDESKPKKTPKRTNKKIKNIESTENGDSNITILKLLNNEEEDSTTNDDSEFKAKTKNKTPKGKKTNLAQLVKKSLKKKRKRGSSDEDEDPEDDSDDYVVEKTANKSIAKKKSSQNEEPLIPSDNLSINETGRRSVRSKKTKYTDNDLNDDDLLMPLTEAELAEPETQTVGKSNMVLTSQDELIVDKILGMRLFKRKTLRKIEKPTKAAKELSSVITENTTDTNEESKVVGEIKKEIEIETETKVEENKVDETKTEAIEANKSREESKSKDEIKSTEESLEKEGLTAETTNEVKKESKEEVNLETQLESKEEINKDKEEDEESEYEEDGGEIETEEFYIKYKNISYLHCEWKSRDELYEIDKRIDQKIKRYKQKRIQHQDCWDGGEESSSYYNTDYDELFNFDYTIVDRILDVYEVEDTTPPTRYYLVKWKALPYDESTWEVEKDIKSAHKIEQFYKQHKMPQTNEYVQRPRPDKWTQITESREFKNGNKLREYQLEGINWLTFCWLNRRNCILADEMGLGKTVQSVTFLNEISLYGINGPFLVLVPLSTIANWLREFETWTNFNAIVYHGSSQSRQLLQDYEFYYKPNGTLPNESNSTFETKHKQIKFNALITTYEVLMSDILLFNEIKWRSIIIDEAHRLKNKNCSLIKMLKHIKIEHKVLLTGTPLQNNVEELFSLLNYLDEEKYASVAEFMSEFSDLKTDTQVNKLQAILKPIMLRRLKEDVEKSLAPKEETIVEVELTNTQKKFYRAILEKNFEFLYKGSKSNSNMPKLINTMMELRKCCNHPYLINGAEEQILPDYNNTEGNSNQLLKAMVQSCGKLVLVDKLLPKLKANGNRVLIFSQMVRILDILEDYLIQKKYTYERLDGRIRGEARQEAIDRYSKKDSDRFVFLLCTRAGGLGINLTAADTVIIYDSDWNPQNDLQAQARVHRIGQKKSVKIYRLITRNTYEREMFDKASLKLGLDKAVLQSMRSSNQTEPQSLSSQQLSKKEIEDLLKKGAYGALMDDDKAGDNFCEEDIDKILQHRSKTIQIDGAPTGINPEKSTFSKASFQVNETNDISIDDPEFWQKWAQKASINYSDKLNPKDERIIDEPRRRIQTKRFIGGLEELEKEEKEDLNDLSLDSSDDDNDKNSKSKSKNGKDLGNKWLKDECLKIEKSLLIFGWSQWDKILENSELLNKKKNKTNIRSIESVEILCRCLLVYILRNNQGIDETIKQQIQILIDPFKSKNGLQLGPKPIKDHHKTDQVKLVLNNLLNQVCNDLEWANNCDDFLEDNYKKHLIRHSNRILTRLKMLSYIRQEIIGDENVQLIDSNQSELQIQIKYIDEQNDDIQSVDWWSKTCDKSLLIGVYKHGFDKYYNMRLDSSLCFLNLIGPPDPKDLLLEQQEMNGEAEESPSKSKRSKRKTIKFPVATELNNRLKRLITSHQKMKKQEQIQIKKEQERLEKLKSKQVNTQLEKQKWSKREEQSFIRTLFQFGVDKLSKNIYNWEHFKEISQLDKKFDHTLNDFYKSFYSQALNDDKSVKLIQRIDLFNKVRQFVLKHSKFTKWLNKCLPNNDLPDWWIPGKHDMDLIKAVSKYGLYKTELYYLNNEEFHFNKYLLKYSKFIENLMIKEKQTDHLFYYQQNQQKIKQFYLKSTNNVVKDVLNDLILEIEIENEPISYFNKNNSVPMHLWLKEKVIIQRLEDIIQMFHNNGQWTKSTQNSDNESVNLEPGEIKAKKGNNQQQRQKANNLDDKSALAALFLAPGLDLNDRITMINIDNGSRLVGNKAPKRGELSSWLIKHPNYLPDESEIIKLTNITQQLSLPSSEDTNSYPDNLILFNKHSGKKHQNDKIKNWKHLCSYLEKNQQLFIDSSCTDLVKSKFEHTKMPEIIKSRFISKELKPQQKVFSSNSSEASSRSSTPTLNDNKSKQAESFLTTPDLLNGDFSVQLANILTAMNGQSNNFGNFGNPFGQSMNIFKDLGIQMPNGFDMNTFQLLAKSLPNGNEEVKSKRNQPNNNSIKKLSTPIPVSSKLSLNNHKTPINQSSNREKSTPINSSMINNYSKRSRNETPSTENNNNNSKKFKNESKETNDILNNPLIDQTKLLQELMNMSQINPAAANPFLFGANLPLLQSSLMMPNTNKSSRSSSPSNENGTDFSISPSSSISSNLPIQPPIDYNLLSNLMSLQMMNNSIPSLMQPSLMQNDLLTNLLAAQGMNAMDPNILSMLALLNQNNEEVKESPTNNKSKLNHNNQQSTPNRQSQRNISSNKNTPQNNSNNSQSNKRTSSSNQSLSSSSSSPRMNKSNTPNTLSNDRSRSIQNVKTRTQTGSETRSKGLDLSSNRRK